MCAVALLWVVKCFGKQLGLVCDVKSMVSHLSHKTAHHIAGEALNAINILLPESVELGLYHLQVLLLKLRPLCADPLLMILLEFCF